MHTTSSEATTPGAGGLSDVPAPNFLNHLVGESMSAPIGAGHSEEPRKSVDAEGGAGIGTEAEAERNSQSSLHGGIVLRSLPTVPVSQDAPPPPSSSSSSSPSAISQHQHQHPHQHRPAVTAPTLPSLPPLPPLPPLPSLPSLPPLPPLPPLPSLPLPVTASGVAVTIAGQSLTSLATTTTTTTTSSGASSRASAASSAGVGDRFPPPPAAPVPLPPPPPHLPLPLAASATPTEGAPSACQAGVVVNAVAGGPAPSAHAAPPHQLYYATLPSIMHPSAEATGASGLSGGGNSSGGVAEAGPATHLPPLGIGSLPSAESFRLQPGGPGASDLRSNPEEQANVSAMELVGSVPPQQELGASVGVEGDPGGVERPDTPPYAPEVQMKGNEPWTAEEDERLKIAVQRHSLRNWKKIARCGGPLPPERK